MYCIKHRELINHSPSVEMISAQNVNEIIYGCCVSIVVVNKTGTLDVFNMISRGNIARVQNFCSVLMWSDMFYL